MARETLAVSGLTSLIRDFKTFDRPVNTAMRQALRQVGDVVKHDVQTFFSPISSKTAAGFKTRVRQRGIAVEQTVGKTTGGHPEYGALQMRSLIRSQHNHEDDINRELEQAMDRICRQFERRR